MQVSIENMRLRLRPLRVPTPIPHPIDLGASIDGFVVVAASDGRWIRSEWMAVLTRWSAFWTGNTQLAIHFPA